MKLFVSILLCLLLFSCNQSPELVKFVRIDNPGEEVVTVSFDDGPELSLAPGETQEISVRSGSRKFRINNEEQVEIHLDADSSYLLNPTRASYVLETISYFPSTEAAERYYEDHQGVTVDIFGFQFEGQYEKIESKLVMPRNWAYGIGYTATPKVNLNKIPRKGYIQKKQLHREIDLYKKIMMEVLGSNVTEED
ncbi:MAG: hypothetical protein AB8F78_02415 [Saprospiraceae bacterium]